VSTRSHTTFKKRQREIARMEKQRDKIAKRAQRKLTAGQEPVESEVPAPDDLAVAASDPSESEPSPVAH